MLQNLSFRLKLATVVLPPIAVMGVMAGVIVAPRITEMGASGHDLHRAELATTAMFLADSLQLERSLSARVVGSGGTDGIADLSEQRRSSDRQAQLLTALLDVADADDMSDAEVAGLVSVIQSIPDLRQTADGGVISASSVVGDYSNQLDLLISEIEQLTVRGADVDLIRGGTAATSFLHGKEFVGRQVALGTAIVLAEAPNPSDGSELHSFGLAQENYFAAFTRLAGEEGLADFEALIDLPAVVRTADLTDQISDAVTAGNPIPVDATEWWDTAWTAQLQFEGPDDDLFEAYTAKAESNFFSARNTAITYGTLAALGALMAAVVAGLLGSSIVKRLRRISGQAHEIATVQLPDVLNALRNPSEEISDALPTVVRDASDEIGSMADSFNTIMRASVETSIEHARRRAKTSTDMLVNLGRRNQALLDRQLEVMDELEEKQQDPETLEGLFKIDHLVTRMRRNAENLLVLASEQQARSWSDAVPLSEVLLAGVSESGDLSRVDIDTDAMPSAMVVGRAAVDLSHLIAELVDNAASFSSPETRVLVRVERLAQNGHRVWVVDSGVGMSDAEIADANQRIAEPPDVDEVSTDRVGFQVVGRLARRIGVVVRLHPNPGGGLAASASMPAALTELDQGIATSQPPVAKPIEVADPTAFGTATVEQRYEIEVDADVESVEQPLPPPPPSLDAGTPVAVDFEPLPVRHELFEIAESSSTGPDRAPDNVAELFPDVAPELIGRDSSSDSGVADFLDAQPLEELAIASPPPAPSHVEPVAADEVEPPWPIQLTPTPAPSEATDMSGPVELAEPVDPPPVVAAPETVESALVAEPMFAEPEADAAPAAPELTIDGLVKRTPGSSFATSTVAEDVDRGAFRRLPEPGSARTAGEDAAQRRLRMLKQLKEGSARARAANPAQTETRED